MALIEATQLFEVKRHQLAVFVRDKRWSKQNGIVANPKRSMS